MAALPKGSALVAKRKGLGHPDAPTPNAFGGWVTPAGSLNSVSTSCAGRQAIGRASDTGIRLRRAICRNIPHSNPQAWRGQSRAFEGIRTLDPTLARFARWLVGFAEACRSGARRLRSALTAAPGIAALSGASIASDRIVRGLAGIVLGGGDGDQRPLVVARQSGGVSAASRRAMGRGGEGTAGHGRSPVIRRHRPPRRSRYGEQDDIWSQEEIAEGLAPAVGDPALRQMLWPVMQHVAALTEGAQVGQPVVGRIAVEMRRRQHDACSSQACCLHEIGPPGQFAAAIPPGRRRRVEPAPVRQAADESKVGPVTPLAPAAGTLEADAAAQRAPVRRIKRSEFATDGHDDPVSFPGTRATLPWRLPSRGTLSAGWLGAACRRAQAAAAQRRTDVMDRGAWRMDSSSKSCRARRRARLAQWPELTNWPPGTHKRTKLERGDVLPNEISGFGTGNGRDGPRWRCRESPVFRRPCRAVPTRVFAGSKLHDKPCRNEALCGNLGREVFRTCWSATCASRPTVTDRCCSGSTSRRNGRVR